jgi:S1-C subfamily serine protease
VRLEGAKVPDFKNCNGAYLRLRELPMPVKAEEISYYTEMYHSFEKGMYPAFRNFLPSEKMSNAISESFSRVCRLFRENKAQVTDSMLSNFAVKILFWTDYVFSRNMLNGSERAFIKITAENVQKEQEYLFYGFLALTGCEVLLLQNRKDVSVRDAFLQLSDSFILGSFGNTVLPEYIPVMKEEPCVKAESNAAVGNGSLTDPRGKKENRPNIKVSIPARERHRKSNATGTVAGKQVGTGQEQTVVNKTVIIPTGNRREEKSFEELARLASSVVMIAVHDREQNVIGTGSGIMIGTDGYILTNFHVAERGRVYSVRIENDDQIYQTDELIKYHPDFDLALIRIDKRLNPLHVYSGASELVRGQKVVAIGSPLGMFNSVSDGIISGFRKFDDLDMIQFTAPISHGSSGGAVLNMYGEVIGISTAGLDDGQNLNLAVGYQNIRRFAGNFMK